jgi:hypothetical protein
MYVKERETAEKQTDVSRGLGLRGLPSLSVARDASDLFHTW